MLNTVRHLIRDRVMYGLKENIHITNTGSGEGELVMIILKMVLAQEMEYIMPQ